MKTSTTITKIAPALLKAQKEIGGAKKGATNPFFKSKYADLGSVMEACKDSLNDNEITVLQPVGCDELGVYVETVLLHSSGEYISAEMRIASKSSNNPQDQGSAITYARRYSLQSMVFIPAEDDDGEKATAPVREAPREYQANYATTPASSDKATASQVKAVYAIGQSKGVDMETYKKDMGVVTLTDLTKQQASEFINKYGTTPF